MWRTLYTSLLASALGATFFIAGCSSGGGDSSATAAAPVYAGSTLPAAITPSNAETIGRSATEGVNEAVKLMATGEGLPLFAFGVETQYNSTALAYKLRDVAKKALQGATTVNLPTGAVLTFDQLNAETGGSEFCGGSVIIPDNIDPNATLNFSMTFNNLCYDDGITAMVMNGVLSFTESADAFSINFSNFSVNIDGTVETFSGSFSCDMNVFDCTIATDFAGSDGNIFRLENVDITGDNLLGYTVGATFYHHEAGMVTLSTDMAVNYGACGVFPASGMISIDGSGGSTMTVAFNSDCTFTVQGSDGSNSFGPDTLTWTL